ncbi:MAG: hypothetical protein AB1716_16785 [Planctomycetota bacterium]
MDVQRELGGDLAEPVPAPAAESPADRESRNPFYRYLMHFGLPMSASLAIHLGIVGFLALKVLQLPLRADAEVGAWAGAVVNKDEIPSAFNWTEPAMPEAGLDLPLEQPDFNIQEFSNATRDELSELSRGESGAGSGDARGEGAGFGLGEGALQMLGTGSGAGESGSGGFGAGMGGGARLGIAGLWNLTVEANRIVYVVDYSGSIVVCVDDLKRELKRSVGQLRPSQSFNVILFYSSTSAGQGAVRTESFRPKLEPATEAARREFFQWIDRKAPMGDTEPLPAVRAALGMKPEAVFFLSDGYFDDKLVAQITEANRATRAKFICLVFEEDYLTDRSDLPPKDKEGSLRLKRIAEQNGGKAKIVTAKDLAR